MLLVTDSKACTYHSSGGRLGSAKTVLVIRSGTFLGFLQSKLFTQDAAVLECRPLLVVPMVIIS